MATLLRRSDLKCWELDGEAVVYDPVSGSGHVLNQTALAIWQLCDGKHTVGDIERFVVAAYPDKHETIHGDVPRTVRELVELGLAQEAA